MEFACSPCICSPGPSASSSAGILTCKRGSGAKNKEWMDELTFKKLMMTLQLGAMAPLSWWAGESDARVRMRENAGGMARKVLCPL